MTMVRIPFLAAAFSLAALPAIGAVEGKPFFSLYNTDLVVAIALAIFIGILVYFKVPAIVGGMLDKRAGAIADDLAEARRLHEEAKALLAETERNRAEARGEAERIVAAARADAEAAAAEAKEALRAAVERRVRLAEDKIAAAEAALVRHVRDRAIAIAIAAAGDVYARGLAEADAVAMIDSGIDQVAARLN
jgi:F-type H+-transporting ATPase subunit b